jgi:serine/threonine-protein kinase
MRVAGFTIEGLLASGSFGTVYRARRDRRLFAIKLVPWDGRAEREADTLRRVRHPNVVGFHGYGLWPDDQPRFLVLALELVRGRPLDVWAREENPSALELVERVVLPLVGTLGEVHATGVVHRDLKEANIVMRESDGLPVLVDFGSAGYEGAPRLTAVLPPGTPEYRSPEAVRFAQDSCSSGPYPASPGDDLWALGVILYGLMTRVLPFGDRDSPGMNRAILEEAPTPPHALNPRVPPALSESCLRLLEKVPEARYADARRFKEALKAAMARADDTWRVPLFPVGRRERRPVSALLRVIRAYPLSRRWLWSAGAALTVALLLGTVAVSKDVPQDAPKEAPRGTPPVVWAHHHVTPQVNFGQGFAAEDMTGEVVSSAGLQRSSTPALIAQAMHREVHPMFKSPKTRSAFIAACLASSACASGPKVKPPPPPEDCPPGSREIHKRFDVPEWSSLAATFDLDLSDGYEGVYVPAREGPILAAIVTSRTKMESGTILSGRLFIETNGIHMRFTEARLPSGERVPVCLHAYGGQKSYLSFGPGGSVERPIVRSAFSVTPPIDFKYN